MELEQSADVDENIHSHSEANSFDLVIGEIEDIIMGESEINVRKVVVLKLT